MRFIFLAIFISGLALAVSSMLHGAERWRRRRSRRPSAVFNPPAVAALGVAAGACGYLLTTKTSIGWLGVLLLSAAAGIVALAGMTVLMAAWALRPSSEIMTAEEDDIHGQIATVSRTIAPGQTGEISYFAWEKHHVLPARALDSSPGSVIPEGSEVVVDSLEDGVARVELWSVVELRL